MVVTVTYRIYDPDLWENLTVGRAIWELHGPPRTQLWTWPTYGAPDVAWAWGFSALLWPVWATGGVTGLFAWRWLTTLAAFGLLWAAARRMGARGFLPLVVMTLGALVWRPRSQVRPETLVAALLALEIWILESRRHGGKDRALWLVPIQWAWLNAHSSYFIGLALIGFHLLEAWRGARRGAAASAPRPRAMPLVLAIVGSVAVSFLNPYGWRLPWQPIDFFLHHRAEPIFQGIGELGPVSWSLWWSTGLPLLVAGWPLLLVARARRSGVDLAEVLCCLFFTALALPAERFAGFYGLVAAPFVSRDLAELFPRPAWLRQAPAAASAALAALACVAVCVLEWMRPGVAIGIGFQWNRYPVAACDFMAAHDVRGRGFNSFDQGGYLLHRFWPDRTRLPFIDVHQAGTPRDRYAYAWARQSRAAWRELDLRHRFDYALRGRVGTGPDSLLDALDEDPGWALVFLDDVAALYVRRAGPFAALARDSAYRELPAGSARLDSLGEACARDPAVRARVARELEREIAASPCHAQALVLLANLALAEARFADARGLLTRALRVAPSRSGTHKRLAAVALAEGRAREALREIGRERRISGPIAGLNVLEGRAWQLAGKPGRARESYRRSLRRHMDNVEARDSLNALERTDEP
jgi:tetratricopeptide (TPR) repeat protein